jgi:hypothetical protein
MKALFPFLLLLFFAGCTFARLDICTAANPKVFGTSCGAHVYADDDLFFFSCSANFAIYNSNYQFVLGWNIGKSSHTFLFFFFVFFLLFTNVRFALFLKAAARTFWPFIHILDSPIPF